MEFQEYPKRIYKGEDSIIVNTEIEEKEFLGVKTDDKENKERMQSSISQGEESQQAKSVQETSRGTISGSGNVQAHEGQEGTPRVLKRKAGRPPKLKT